MYILKYNSLSTSNINNAFFYEFNVFFSVVLHSLMQSWHMEVIILSTFFEVNVSLESMCQILVSFLG